ncbi:metal ABC transporter solute-binding protein, Zn/Mn family [Bradyrhizobium sp. URHC0002]|jgi:zinc/manganese transport system substrate-binding protein
MKSDTSIRAQFRVIFAGVAILLGASVAGAAERIKVVATFSVIGDMVANVAGDKVDLVTLVGPAGDTELFKPSLADGKSVAEAKIVFMNDLNDEFEPWLEPLLKQVNFSGAKIVVSRGVKTFTSTEERAPRNKSGEEEIDQHAWLDPKNAIIYVRNIAAALVKGDPANASDYRLRADAYIKEMQALDAWAKAEIAALPAAKRRFLASHDSLQYLAKAYGITLLSINGWTNNSEPSAAELARLAKQVRQERIHALFLDSITDPRAMQQVAKETGASIGGTLYGDALSKPGGDADTYLKMLRHNVATLKAGMMKN